MESVSASAVTEAEADAPAEVLAVGVSSEVQVGVVSTATSKVGVSLEDPTHTCIIHVHKWLKFLIIITCKFVRKFVNFASRDKEKTIGSVTGVLQYTSHNGPLNKDTFDVP